MLALLLSLVAQAAPPPFLDGCTLEDGGALKTLMCPQLTASVHDGPAGPPQEMADATATGWLTSAGLPHGGTRALDLQGVPAARIDVVEDPTSAIYVLHAAGPRMGGARVVRCIVRAVDEGAALNVCAPAVTWLVANGAPTGLAAAAPQGVSLSDRLGGMAPPAACEAQVSHELASVQCPTGALQLMVVPPGREAATFHVAALEGLAGQLASSIGASATSIDPAPCGIRGAEATCHRWTASGAGGSMVGVSGPLTGPQGDAVFVCVWGGGSPPEACAPYLTRAPE